MSKNVVYIIGAGQLGSRHLQALKAVPVPLSITVVDPNGSSLQTAKERYEAVQASNAPEHEMTFSQTIPAADAKVQLAVVATNANVRREVIEQTLAGNQVQYFILEKLLFQRKADYPAMEKLLSKRQVRAWVNCSMRTMPFYADLRKITDNGKVDLTVTGGQYGLVTNAIHYLDYIAYLTNCNDYSLDTSQLLPEVIPSKRPGFSELNGALYATFTDGSTAHLRCYPAGTAPTQVTVSNEYFRCISRESEKRAWLAEAKTEWKWQDIAADIPFQSAMTTKVVGELLASGSCPLTSFSESVRTHLQLLEPLQVFLQTHGQESTDYYPFT